MAISEETKQTIGKALGRVASGVFVLTARQQDRTAAMLASWVQQAGFDPPALSVAVARGRPVVEMIRQSGRFAVSILGEKDMALMKKYARGVADAAEAFAGVNILEPAGVPVLADALAYLDCRLLNACAFGGDHELLIGQIIAGKVLKDGASFTHLRGSGFHY